MELGRRQQIIETSFTELEEIQNERPNLIDSQVDVWDRLRGVSKSDIDAQCRCMKDRQARGVPVARVKPALLHPSLAL